MTETAPPMVYLKSTFYNSLPADSIAGIEFTIVYTDAQAEVSIVEMPLLYGPKHLDEFRKELKRLGSALLEVAQSPKLISRHPLPED